MPKNPLRLFRSWIWIVAMGIALIAVPWAYGLYYWAGLWAGVMAVVAVMEIVAKVKTDRTLSQQFWRFTECDIIAAVVVLGGMIICFAVLIFHLMAGP